MYKKIHYKLSSHKLVFRFTSLAIVHRKTQITNSEIVTVTESKIMNCAERDQPDQCVADFGQNLRKTTVYKDY